MKGLKNISLYYHEKHIKIDLRKNVFSFKEIYYKTVRSVHVHIQTYNEILNVYAARNDSVFSSGLKINQLNIACIKDNGKYYLILFLTHVLDKYRY